MFKKYRICYAIIACIFSLGYFKAWRLLSASVVIRHFPELEYRMDRMDRMEYRMERMEYRMDRPNGSPKIFSPNTTVVDATATSPNATVTDANLTDAIVTDAIVTEATVTDALLTDASADDRPVNRPEDFIGYHRPKLPFGQVVGSLKKSQFIMGIPTAERPDGAYYLFDTLEKFITLLRRGAEEQRREEENDFAIIVFVSGSNSEYFKRVNHTICSYFAHEVATGNLVLAIASQTYYPDYLNNGTGSTESLKEMWDDPIPRVIWRTRQCLDYIFLWMFAEKNCDYYIQLEDDVWPKGDFLKDMRDTVTAKTQTSPNWMTLEFSHRGFIGRLFRADILSAFINYALLFFKVKPIDWIYGSFHRELICSPEWNDKECLAAVQKVVILIANDEKLEHKGVKSSLAGKTWQGPDKVTDEKSLPKPAETAQKPAKPESQPAKPEPVKPEPPSSKPAHEGGGFVIKDNVQDNVKEKQIMLNDDPNNAIIIITQ